MKGYRVPINFKYNQANGSQLNDPYMFGFNILNKGVKNKPLSYEVFTQYASKEKTLVGSFNFKYQLNNEVKTSYSKQNKNKI